MWDGAALGTEWEGAACGLSHSLLSGSKCDAC